MHNGGMHSSPPGKKRRFATTNEKGRFVCVEPLSANFVSNFYHFRKTFHDARRSHTQPRPLGSKNDYGWYPLLTKQWPEWIKSARAETSSPPTKSILSKLWTARNDVQISSCLTEGAADAVQTNLITKFNQPHAPDKAVAGGCTTVTPSRIDLLSGQALLSAPPPSVIGDRPACEASGCEAIAQLELLLQCAARAQAAVALPPPEPQLRIIDPVGGAPALGDGIKVAITAGAHLLPGVSEARVVGRGAFGTVLALFSGGNEEGQGRAAARALGQVVKVANSPCKYSEIIAGLAGTEALVLNMVSTLAAAYAARPLEIARVSGGVPFVRPCMCTPSGCFGDASLVAVSDGLNLWRPLLITEAAEKNSKSHVVHLGTLFGRKDGQTDDSDIQQLCDFIKSLIQSLFWVHFLSVAHRDIKPDNLLLIPPPDGSLQTSFKDTSGNLKVVRVGDFGLALTAFATYGTPSFVAKLQVEKPRRIFQSPVTTARAEHIRAQNFGASPKASPKIKFRMITVAALKNQFNVVDTKNPVNTSPASQVPQFRRDGAGTHVYQGPEIPFGRDIPPMTSKAFMPSDIYAVGYIMLRILSGYVGNDFALKHCRVFEQTDREALGLANFQQIWSNYLFRSAQSEPLAGSWMRDAVELAMGLVNSNPDERLSCSQALKHRFFTR